LVPREVRAFDIIGSPFELESRERLMISGDQSIVEQEYV
jgi:hypothetical protein